MPAGQRSPKARISRSKTSLGEVVQDGQLPTIVEGKPFPRKTLEYEIVTIPCLSVGLTRCSSAEISALNAETASESPEIGPPPTTYLDQEDVETAQVHNVDTQFQALNLDDVEVSGLFSANFETRRRRRETYVRSDDTAEVPPNMTATGREKAAEDVSNRPLRAGAKRKLDIQDRPWPSKGDAHDVPQFDFTRKIHERSGCQSPTKMAAIDLSVPTAAVVLRAPTASAPPLSPIRKALIPSKFPCGGMFEQMLIKIEIESANMSPRKVQHSDKPKDKDSMAPIHKINDVVQDQLKSPTEIEVHAIYTVSPKDNLHGFVEIKEEPQTPAFLDLISPPSTQASDTQPGSTSGRPSSPRPSNARGSRRSRPQISYAEPNLISKMRRPTKDLVDAVGRDNKQSGNPASTDTGSVKKEEKPEDVAQTLNPAAVRTILINRAEPFLGKDWKPASASVNQTITRPEPQSPLREKDEVARSKASAERTASRERRRSTFHPPGGRDARQSGSSAAISTLMALPGRNKGFEVEEDMEGGDAQSRELVQDTLDIYDVKDSPPPPPPPSHPSTNTTTTTTTRPPSRPLSRSSSSSTTRRQTLSNNTIKKHTEPLPHPLPPQRAWNSNNTGGGSSSSSTRELKVALAEVAKEGGKVERGAGVAVGARRRSMML